MALTLLAVNNAQTVLASGINSTATTLTVNTGTGNLFPSPVPGTSFFKLTLVDSATGSLTEIVHVTARTGDIMTIERGQESTIPRAWSANDIVANMMTAGTLSYILGNFQPLDPTLTALAALVGVANKLPYFNGNDTATLTDLTQVGRDIIGKSSVADILTYLGFTSGTGWLRFPSGHILQYGSAGGFESYTIVLPVPYTNTNYIAVANGTGNTSPPDTGRVFVETANVDNGSFTAICINADGTRSSRGIGWIAFGK
ncbi:TPA: hypothetical protein ACPE2G_000300 [Citrobacter braakii]